MVADPEVQKEAYDSYLFLFPVVKNRDHRNDDVNGLTNKLLGARCKKRQRPGPVLSCQGKNPTRVQSPTADTIITDGKVKDQSHKRRKIINRNISNSCNLVWHRQTFVEVQLNRKSSLDNYVPTERVGCSGTKKESKSPKTWLVKLPMKTNPNVWGISFHCFTFLCGKVAGKIL